LPVLSSYGRESKELKPWMHFAVATVLAFGSIFFAWIWFVSGQSCIPTPLGVQGCTFNPRQANISFVSLAFDCALLTCIESVIGFKSRKVGKLVPEPARQHKFRVWGIWLMIIGAIIAFAGFYEVNNTLVMCPAGGCSASEIMTIYGPLYAIFYSGMTLVVLGDPLILATKFMKTLKPLQRDNAVNKVNLQN
jgi:hypothetical protein